MDDDALVDALRDIDDEKLSTWELDFIESIGDRTDCGYELTEAQREKAEEILERADRRKLI